MPAAAEGCDSLLKRALDWGMVVHDPVVEDDCNLELVWLRSRTPRLNKGVLELAKVRDEWRTGQVALTLSTTLASTSQGSAPITASMNVFSVPRSLAIGPIVDLMPSKPFITLATLR
jgi:hypothetical protein